MNEYVGKPVAVFIADLLRSGLKLVEDCPPDNAQIWTDGRLDYVLFYDDNGKVIGFGADGIHLGEGAEEKR